MKLLDYFDMLFEEVGKVWGEGIVIMLCVTSELWSDFIVHIIMNETKRKSANESVVYSVVRVINFRIKLEGTPVRDILNTQFYNHSPS